VVAPARRSVPVFNASTLWEVGQVTTFAIRSYGVREMLLGVRSREQGPPVTRQERVCHSPHGGDGAGLSRSDRYTLDGRQRAIVPVWREVQALTTRYRTPKRTPHLRGW
jgi:hypothetical protein